MKLIIYTNLHKKFKKGVIKEMSKEPLILYDVERFEVSEK